MLGRGSLYHRETDIVQPVPGLWQNRSKYSNGINLSVQPSETKLIAGECYPPDVAFPSNINLTERLTDCLGLQGSLIGFAGDLNVFERRKGGDLPAERTTPGTQ
jgi:hypothetical protein